MHTVFLQIDCLLCFTIENYRLFNIFFFFEVFTGSENEFQILFHELFWSNQNEDKIDFEFIEN